MNIGRIPNTLFLVLIRAYQWCISPILHALVGPSGGCRHHPSCSRYAATCFQRLPFFKALGHTLRRISRCHPWGTSGYDPPPE